MPEQQGQTVGSYFDRPPAYPGEQWVIDGRDVDSKVVEAFAGPSHCGWESATFLFLGWPPGTVAQSGSQARQFIRDRNGQMSGAQLLGTWAHDPTLPHDALDTGYRYGAIKLFFAPSDEDQYAYLVAPADRERWPRSDPLTLCS